MSVVNDLRAKCSAIEEFGKIDSAANAFELTLARELVMQRHTVSHFSVRYEAGDHVVDFAVRRNIEIRINQDFRHAVVRIIVKQDRAEDCSLCSRVVGRILSAGFCVIVVSHEGVLTFPMGKITP